MRLTGQFAVTGLLAACLAALPLGRLWAIGAAYGDPHAQVLAQALALAGVAVLAGLFVLLRLQLLAPLKAAVATLRSDAAAAPPPSASTGLRDLAAMVEAVPSLRRSIGDLAALEQAVQEERERLGARATEFGARSQYLQALVDAVPLPLAMRDAQGCEVLANRLWREAPTDTLLRDPVTDAAGQTVGGLLIGKPPSGAAGSPP